MIGFVNGKKLLAESNLLPQWNLLTGTKDFSGEWSNLTKSTDTFGDFGVANYFNKPWTGTGQYYIAMVGIYTFSFWAKNLNGTISVKEYISLNGNIETTPSGKSVTKADVNGGDNTNFQLTNDWQKYTSTFSVKSIGAIKPRIETGSDSNKIQIAGFKLERGTKATTWMPAISDLALKSDLGGKSPL